jgi:acyl-CoA dehydrogenase
MTSPFLLPEHEDLRARVREFAATHLESVGEPEGEEALFAASRRILRLLGDAGFLQVVAPARLAAGSPSFSLRALVVIREALGHVSSLADTLFAVQGLGAHPVVLAGTERQRAQLSEVARGEIAVGFALTEANAGSDLSGIETRATLEAGFRDGDRYRLHGVKIHISNAGFAARYSVLARTGDASDPRPFSMFLVDAGSAGLKAKTTDVIAAHPFGELHFDGTRAELIGGLGDGLRLALATLDAFRPSVGAAAVGMARRAQDEALAHARARHQFGRPLSAFQATQLALADSETDIDAARLLVHHAAWLRDTTGARLSREGSMAKLFATEMAQRVIDRSVQIHGARGVVKGSIPERLYREIRSLRIYEGASDVQRLGIARSIV